MSRAGLIPILLLLVFTSTLAQNDTVSLIEKYTLDELINLKITTATRNEQKIEEVAANVEVITSDEIKRFGFRDLDELLQTITGFYKIEDYYWLGSTNYGVRGYFKTGPFSNVAILINGVNQVSDKYYDYPDVKITLPIEAIERIEIIKGPMAVVYGNGAFFGVINIITNDNNAESKNKVLVEKGFPNSNKAFAQIAGNSDEFDFKFITGYDDDIGLDVPYTSLTTDTSYLEYVGLDADSRTKGQLEMIRFYSGLNLNYKGFTFDVSYNNSNKGVFDGSPAFNHGNQLRTQATNSVLGYKHEVGKDLKLSYTFGYFSHSHLLDYELFRKYYYEVDMQQTGAVQAEINLKYNPSEIFSITGNLSRRRVLELVQISDFGYYGLNYGDGKAGLPEGDYVTTHSLFVQSNIRLYPKLFFVVGGRLEHLAPYNMYVSRGVVSENPADNRDPNDPKNRYMIESIYKPDHNGFTFVPRLSFIYELSSKHFFKLIYGEAQKQPSFSENYRQLPDNRPVLHPSSIQTLELNYYTYSLNNLIINSSVFVNRLNNLIESTNIYDAENGVWEIYSANSGMYTTAGFEGELTYRIDDKAGFDLRGIFQKTRNLKFGYDEIDVAYSPSFIGYLDMYYNLTDNITVASNMRYIDMMYSAWETETMPENGHRIGDASPPLFLLGFNLSVEDIFNKNVFISFKVENMLNSSVRYPVTFSNAWINKGAMGEGISFYLRTGIYF